MERSRPALSLVVPVRDRSGIRLENCLRSFRWQSVDPAAVEIVLSDFGSVAEHRRSLEELAFRYGARTVRTETEEVWNRSRALNIGIQAAGAPYVMCTDVDIILKPNFVGTVLEAHHRAEGETMVHCRCHNLPESLPEKLWSPEEFDELAAQAIPRPTPGTGACQSAPTAFFRAVRGYDEKYRHYGNEDLDMTARARSYGVTFEWISDRTMMLHQYHPPVWRDRMLLRRLNRWRYVFTHFRVVKNPRGWGNEP